MKLTEENIERLQEALDTLEKEIANLQGYCSHVQSEIDELENIFYELNNEEGQ